MRPFNALPSNFHLLYKNQDHSGSLFGQSLDFAGTSSTDLLFEDTSVGDSGFGQYPDSSSEKLSGSFECS